MIDRKLHVAVGRGDWHADLAEALDRRIGDGAAADYAIVDIDAHDWQDRLAPFDLIIWKGRFMGPQLAGHYKEKVYFIERILGKSIVPGYASVWHFESKIAQSYIFALSGIPSPKTVASFDYDDALRCLRQAQFPIVAKQSHGAASSNVRLIRSKRKAEKWLAAAFCQEMWDRHKTAYSTSVARLGTALWHSWFWPKVKYRALGADTADVAYWQEYVPHNDADLRITVIGDAHAFGFWRGNRPGDFRASGSGLLDYATAIPEQAVRYCMDLNRRFGFDSMAYDLLFQGEDMIILEMSYGYLDKAVFDAPGHFSLDDRGCLVYQRGHVMPQDLWVDWALRKAMHAIDGG